LKTKLVFFLVIIAGIIFYGCVSVRKTQITPYFKDIIPGENTGYQVPEFEAGSMRTQYNPDGTITLFSKGSFHFRIMPMTDNNMRGALSRTNGEFDTLIKRYETDLAANPQDFDACIMLTGLYIDRGRAGDADLALKYSNMALSIRQDDAEALYARGLAYNKKGDSSLALGDLVTVLRTNIQSMKGVYYIMGTIYYKEGKTDEAIEAFEKVKTIDPEFVDTNEILEMLYKKKV
jgi:tetratricopeptide (TPR) repeat protein